jgi:hypothetical protein
MHGPAPEVRCFDSIDEQAEAILEQVKLQALETFLASQLKI